jgi:hypothetical protein
VDPPVHSLPQQASSLVDGRGKINGFLSSLAVEGHVAAATQNQALSAIVFLDRQVLQEAVPSPGDIVRARRPRRLPVVLRLRVKDVDFKRFEIVVRGGKGDKDRVTMLPEAASNALQSHLVCVRRWTSVIWRKGSGGSGCRTRWRGSLRTRSASGTGSMSSRRRGAASIRGAGWSGGIMWGGQVMPAGGARGGPGGHRGCGARWTRWAQQKKIRRHVPTDNTR